MKDDLIFVTVDQYKIIRDCAIDDSLHTDGSPMIYFSEACLSDIRSKEPIYAWLEKEDRRNIALGICQVSQF